MTIQSSPQCWSPESLDHVRGVAEQEAADTDATGAFPTKTLAAMRASGLLGLCVPATYGGLDGRLGDVADIAVALGRVDLSTALIFVMHCQQVAVIARYGSDQLRDELLPAIATGGVYLSSITTEPGNRGRIFTSQSRTSVSGDGLHVVREAPIVTGGRHADGFVVTALAPDATSPAQVDLVYLGRSQIDVTVLGGWESLGMRATESVPLRLEGRVPVWQVLGSPGQFRAMAIETFVPYAHVGWSAAWIGAAAGALSRVLTSVRQHGRGQPPGELQLASIADIRARIDVMHAFLRHTIATVEAGHELSAPPVQLQLNALKIRAADECFAVAHELMEIAGLRDAYLTGSALGLERTFRDLRSASLNYGNNRIRLSNGALALRDVGVRLV
jgi:acyl-CoA dehydrogenase